MKAPGILFLVLLATSLQAAQDNLDWMAGCWETPDGRSVEAWSRNDDGLAGFSVDLGNNEVRFFEILVLGRNEAGRWVYSASPGGADATRFVEEDRTENSIRFVNPAHDFPQEISYRREDTRLVATISATGGDKQRVFRKQVCD